MSVWVCDSPGRCCQPAVAGGFIYADLRNELSTHLAPQALFTQSSPVHDHHCYKLSPFQAHGGRWHYIRLLRLACLFTVHVGSGSSPLSSGAFLTQPLLQAFPLLVAGCVPPLLPSLASLSTVLWVIPLPPFSAQGTPPSLLQVFLLLFIQFGFFLFFPLVWVGLSRVLCWSGPGLFVGVLCAT
jgi:hypothetical protein